jgi:hypothetical protein
VEALLLAGVEVLAGAQRLGALERILEPAELDVDERPGEGDVGQELLAGGLGLGEFIRSPGLGWP